MRRIDLHAYPGTREWLDSQGPFAEALGRYWGRDWTAASEAEVVAGFRQAGVEAVLVAFDIETVVGAPPCGNDYVASLRDRHPGTILQAWGAVDPHKGEAAIKEAERAVRELGVLGFHFHPIMGRYQVDDQQLYPLWETIAALGVPVMIDVGTTGMGAGMPGGLGSRLSHAHPMAVDNLAADFPGMTIVAAHPGWPWVEEMTAVALHKGNVSWELAGVRAAAPGRALANDGTAVVVAARLRALPWSHCCQDACQKPQPPSQGRARSVPVTTTMSPRCAMP